MRVLELLAEAALRELLRGLGFGLERGELALVALDQLFALGAKRALRLRSSRGARGALGREVALGLGQRGLRGGRGLGLGFELLLELRGLRGRRLEARGEVFLLAAVLEDALLELAVLALERRLRVLRLAQLLLGLGELLRLLLDGDLDLLELLVLGDVLLAQVQELTLATAALGGGVRGGARALELGLELGDLPLELADLAERLAIVEAGLLALGAFCDHVEPEVDRRMSATGRVRARGRCIGD